MCQALTIKRKQMKPGAVCAVAGKNFRQESERYQHHCA
jgi:hypothetical protein